MQFRPCIDLREGRVVQIVGGSIRDAGAGRPTVNFETDRSPADYARMYKNDGLPGGHVISLGPGNLDAAMAALRAYPGGLQMGGGITPENASEFLDAGASHVIVTSYVFREGKIDCERLGSLVKTVGKERLVLDLSCRKRDGEYWVVTDRWQCFTELRVCKETLEQLAGHCAEFLVHGVDVEGRQTGIETELVDILGEWAPIPATYAGGAKEFADLDRVKEIGKGRVDLTIGSALDIFGGRIPYKEVVAWSKAREADE
jgi:phosphoribosylformimino-5-aminoimidazole carboxamide ribotide isomerase